MGRWLKLVVATLAALAVVSVLDPKFLAALRGRAVTVTFSARDPRYRPIPPSRRPTIASIVYLTAHGLAPGTLTSLRQMHASEVYLYAAYYSDAYYQIPSNPYGMAEPADALVHALEQLHRHHMRVIVVISSALLQTDTAPSAGRRLLQGTTAVFNPLRASRFVESLTRALLRYPIDGLYIGEPYWVKSIPRPVSEQPFVRLYRTLLAMTHRAHVPFNMVLSSDYYYVGGQNYSGLGAGFAELPFHSIGIDGEYLYYSVDPRPDLGYVRRMAAAAVRLAHGRPAILELSLRQNYPSTNPIPPAFFAKELEAAHHAGIHTIVIFANEFWAKSPYRAQYAYALAQFAANR